jgi:hypothetical protein
MKKAKYPIITLLTILIVIVVVGDSYSWHDETHVAIAKAAGYKKWFNAAAADMLKIKAGYKERLNHYTNHPRETVVTPEMVFEQIEKYNRKSDHSTLYNAYNRKNHHILESLINDEVLNNIERIKIYEIKIESEEDLAKEIARIANLSMKKGYQIEDENRLLTKEEIYDQISHSASLFKAILRYVDKVIPK